MFQLLPQRILSGARVKLIETPAAPSDAVTESAALVPDGPDAGGPAVPLTRRFTLVGARNSARLRLVSPEISRSHAAIISSSRSFYVRDLASRTGLLINGQVVREAELAEGDALHIGTFVYRVRFPTGKLAVSDPEAVAAAAVQVHGAAPVRIEGRSLLIGRRPNCDLSLADAEVSSTHALIFEMDGSHHLRDLSSRTGTYLNDKRVKRRRLGVGDVIRVGRTELHYVPAVDSAPLPAGALPPVVAWPQAQTVSVALPPVAATYGDEAVVLTAMIESRGKLVNEGTVAFSLERGHGTIASLPSVAVSDGVAKTVLSLKSLVPGGYVVLARYDPGPAAELGFLESSGTNTLIVRKAWAAMALEGLSAVYDGTPHRATVVTQPPGLEGVMVSYGGGSEPPINVGHYPVVVRVDHPCYRAAPASGVLVIAPAERAVESPAPIDTAGDDFVEPDADPQESPDAPSAATDELAPSKPVEAEAAARALQVEDLQAPAATPANPAVPLALEPPASPVPPAHLLLSETEPPAEPAASPDPSAGPSAAPEPLAPPQRSASTEPPAPQVAPESPQPVGSNTSQTLDYFPVVWELIHCDQGSFIGGLPFEAQPPPAGRGQSLPTSANDASAELERNTTVVRGVSPRGGRDHGPAARGDAKRAKPSKGLFKRIFRPRQ